MTYNQHCLNFSIIIVNALIFLVLFFLQHCLFNAENKCMINGSLVLPLNLFNQAFSKGLINLFNYNYPYFWIILSLVFSTIIIKNKPNPKSKNK